jgi:hypothetical protein
MGGIESSQRPAVGADATNAATRHLCVGAHLDQSFNDQVLSELFGQTHRAVAPSYGFDVGLVLAHCLAARQRRHCRDLLLAAAGLTACLLGPLHTVLVGLFWSAVVRRVDAFCHRNDESWESPPAKDWIPRLAVALAMAWLVVLILLLSKAMPVLDAVKRALFVGTLAGFTGGVVLYAVTFGELVRRRLLYRELRREQFHQRPSRDVRMARRLRERLDTITWGQLGNVTVYSGYDPFVGTGEKLRGWDFTTSLVAAPNREAVESFSVPELVDHVRARINELRAPEDGPAAGAAMSDSQIPGLIVSDQIFVHGLEIEQDERFLPKPGVSPRTLLSSEEVQNIACAPQGAARHYCSVQVRSWGGEIVTFTLFHFSAAGGKLHFECVRRVLPPIKAAYHLVDMTRARPTLTDWVGLMAEAAVQTVPTFTGAPFRLAKDIYFDLWSDRRPKGTSIDYGARFAVRQAAADVRFHNYFQYVDNEKHLKFIERTVLSAICEFLENHGIDTTEFRKHQTNLLNMGIIQLGDNLTIGAVALGAQASAVNEGEISIQSSNTGDGRGND